MEDLQTIALPRDGRQSERALTIFKGVGRLMRSFDFACVPEMTLPNHRRADVCGLGRDGEIWIVEIKSSVEDFRTDGKWQDYLEFCDRFFFATLPDVPADIFPDTAGLMISDGFGADVIRESPVDKLAAARRKALTLRLARHVAHRLHTAIDPASAAGMG